MKGTAKERLAVLDALYPVWEEHTLWTRFAKNAARYSECPFLIYQEDVYTYRQVEESRRLSRSLFAIGVRPGDHVAVFLYNSPVFLYTLFLYLNFIALY